MVDFTYPVPAHPPDEGSQITVRFGLEWLALVLDAVDNLEIADLFEAPPDDIGGQIDQLLTLLMTDVTMPPQVFPTYGFHFHGASKVTVGNALSLSVVASQMFNGTWFQSPAAQHDKFEFKLLLAAGNYTMNILYQKSTASGILEVFFNDGYSQVSFDMYATATYNQLYTATVVVDEDKEVLIRCEVNTKNASSNNFRAFISAFWFEPQ